MALGQLRSRFAGDRRVYDVGDYGALPGISDSSSGIQAALDQASTDGGGAVLFSRPGTYYVSGANRTAGSTFESLNAALLVYDNTEIVCAPGVEIKLGYTKDSARCYLLRNADPTGGNQGIVIDGGFWNGGGIVEECLAPNGTTMTIVGDYAARIPSGTTFNVSDVSGKTAYTASVDSTYSSGTGLTTITVASGAKAGGLQVSWQQPNAQSPAIASITEATNTLTITGDYTAFGSAGSSIFIYGNSDSSSNMVYVIDSISHSGGTTTIVTTTDMPAGIGTVTRGNCAFIYDAVWYSDLIRLQNVTGLSVRNTKGGGCDKYVWHVIGCKQAQFDNNTFDNGSDGIHLAGGNVGVAIRDTYGRTLDNLVAVVTDEKWYRPAQTDIAGNCSNILVDGVYLDANVTCFEPFRATGTSSYTIDGLTCRNFYGTIGSGYGCRFADDTATGFGLLVGCVMRRVLVENMNLIVPAGYSVVQISGTGVKDVTCRDIHLNLATNQAVLITTPANDTAIVNPESVSISGLTTGVATTTKLVQVDAIVDKLTMDNFDVKLGVGGVVVQPSNTDTDEGLIKDGVLSNSVIEAANGSGSSQCVLFLNTTAAMKSRINLVGVSMRQTNGSGTFNPIQCNGQGESDWNGVDITGTSGTCYIFPNSANCVLRVTGSSVKATISGSTVPTNFVFGTSGAMTINCPTLPVGFGASNGFAARVSGQIAGDTINNTSAFSVTAAQQCVGPGLYRWTGVFWEYVGTSTVVARTADTTLAEKHSGNANYTNTGASGTITFTLPAATVGQRFTFTRTAAQVLRIDPNGTETIALPSTGVQGGAGKYLSADTTGSTVILVCSIAGAWNVAGYSGTFTAEP